MKKLLITLTCLLALSSFLVDARRRDKCCPKRCPKKVCCPKKKCCPKPECCPAIKRAACPEKITSCIKVCCPQKKSEPVTTNYTTTKIRLQEKIMKVPEVQIKKRWKPVQNPITYTLVEEEYAETVPVDHIIYEPVKEEVKGSICRYTEELDEPCCKMEAVTRRAKPLPKCR